MSNTSVQIVIISHIAILRNFIFNIAMTMRKPDNALAIREIWQVQAQIRGDETRNFPVVRHIVQRLLHTVLRALMDNSLLDRSDLNIMSMTLIDIQASLIPTYSLQEMANGISETFGTQLPLMNNRPATQMALRELIDSLMLILTYSS